EVAGWRHWLVALVAGYLGLAGVSSSGAAAGDAARVVAYPSSTTIRANGIPAGGAERVGLNVARGEREGAWLLVMGAATVSARGSARISVYPTWLSGRVVRLAA